MHIRPPSRLDAPVSRPSRSRRRALRAMLVGSLALHALVLAVLLVSLPKLPQPQSPPAASFEIVTDGGAANPVTPGQDAAPPAATPGTDAPVPGPQPSPDPGPAPTQQPPAQDVAPPELTAPEPMPPEPAPPDAAPTPETPPAPVTRPAPPRVELNLPSLPDEVPLLQQPPPLPELPRPPTPPRPRPLQLARPRLAPRNPFGFPTPQDWSFSGGLPSHPSQSGASGQASLAGPSAPAPRITGAELGRDWLAAYTAWVRAHMYYPEQAAENGEDGTAEVVLSIDRYGKVLSVQLVTRSGSQWLDLETTGLFRGARVPPFPQGTKEDTATIDQTIHYVLQRR